MNEENLKKFTEYTPEELQAVSSRGGKASAESRRRRKALKEELTALLSDGDVQERLCVALMQRALDGDIFAFKAIRDTIGEKEPEQLLLSGGKVDEDGVRNYLKENYLEEFCMLTFDEDERERNGEERRYGALTVDLATYEMRRSYLEARTNREELMLTGSE